MNLEALQALVAVVEHGSVLAAAEALDVSRTTLRRRLDDLESRAGLPLLHRSPAGVAPTEAGQHLVDRGRQMLAEADAMLAAVRELGRDPAGVVRILVPPGMPPHVLVPLYQVFRHRFPKLSIDLRFAATGVPGLPGEVDLAIQYSSVLPEGPWRTFVIHRITERLVASRGWLAAHGAPASLAELRPESLFCWAAPDRRAGHVPLRDGGVFEVTPAVATADAHLLHHLAYAGAGVSLVPDGMLPDPAFGGERLEPVLSELVGRSVPLWLVVPEALEAVPKIRVVVEAIRAAIGDLPQQ